MSKPLISIITVVYNDCHNIEETILSIINQSYSNFEFVVIDGGSTDGTLEKIIKYKEHINFLISESDTGIYDAMNKGIDNAKGEWVNFMNSGDLFFDNDTLNNIFNQEINDGISVLYGNTFANFFFGKYIVKPLELSEFKNTIPFCHQSTFTRLAILKENKFDTNFILSADYNLFFKLYFSGVHFLYCNICISRFEAEEGQSSKNVVQLINEHSEINGYKKKMAGRFSMLLMKIKYFVSCIMPKSLLIHLYIKHFSKDQRYLRV